MSAGEALGIGIASGAILQVCCFAKAVAVGQLNRYPEVARMLADANAFVMGQRSESQKPVSKAGRITFMRIRCAPNDPHTMQPRKV